MSAHIDSITREYDSLFARARAAKAAVPKAQRVSYNIRTLQPGAIVALENATYEVEGRHEYRETGTDDVVIEYPLRDLATGAVRYLELAEDDELEICISVGEARSLSDLDLSDDLFDAVAEAEDDLRLDGLTYEYEDDWESRFHKDGGATGVPLYVYEYEAPGDRYLTVEEWPTRNGESDYEVWLTKPLKLHNIEVLST